MTLHLLDIGSTSIKFARYDMDEKRKYGEGSKPFPDPLPRHEPLFEVSIDAIVNIVKEILSEVRLGDHVRISTQMHGYLLCDGRGVPVTPYISWRDQRSLCIPEEDRYPFELPKTRGVGKKTNLPLASLHAMKKLAPAMLDKAEMFCSLGSYLMLALTGRNCSHISDLAPTGMYDARTGEACPIPFENLALPVACDESEPAGVYLGAEVFAPVGDQQASVAGSGLKKDQYLLNLGTAAQLCTLSDEPVYGEYESRPYFAGRVLCTVTGLIGGREYDRIERENDVDALVNSYGGAAKLLLERASIRAVGGVCKHHRRLVEETLNRIGLPWEICEQADALDGLILLAERKDG